MTLDLNFYLFAVPAVIFAGMSKGGFGSAAAFAATPFLALILTPGQAVGLMLPLLMVMDVTAVKLFWRKWDLRVAGVLILGAIPGIVIGTLLYGVADPAVFKLLIGIVAIGFVLWQLAKARRWITPPKRELGTGAGLFWGGVTGLTSFISHAGGPPAAVYMLSKRMDKTTYQASSVLTFWAVNLMKVVPYAFVGIFSKETLIADLTLIPAAVLGVLLGVWMYHKVPEKLFFGLAYVFLVITGSKLIWEVLAA
ncbi:sulfite exporter TauE/SafE family protein [Celeribacter naphthalenivorans]|uniref:sulfite exporter TauE/SafE family protein n=1 Tax=Celeribacter naphthalenivorans TaxID=1614694 RepID=UPI001CFA85F5|nr:sulfite exporter TauE/SafE family protein [Celeribacter naphthalenivorans]